MGNLNKKMELTDKNIENVYDNISTDFDLTRYNVWTSVKRFLDSLPKDCQGLEVGCGNGKNMIYAESKNLKIRGIDLSEEMIKICKNKNLLVNKNNMLQLPFLNRTFDFVICVASLHHLDTLSKRNKALEEIFRVTKDGGVVFISVWASQTEQSEDKMVPFYSKEKKETFYRFYHFYEEAELEFDIINLNQNIKIIESYNEKNNWIVVVQKINSISKI